MPRAFGHKKSEDRRPVDFYPTPDRLAVACCRAVHSILPRPPMILEPSAGSGAFVRAAKGFWPEPHLIAVEVRSEEKENLLAADCGANAVATMTLEEFLPSYHLPPGSLVIGNPPYSLAQEHIMLLLDWLAPGSTIAFLLKLGFLGTKDRADLLWKQGQCKYVWPILGRPSFVKGDRASSDVNEYALFIWEVGYGGLTIVKFPHIRWKGKGE